MADTVDIEVRFYSYFKDLTGCEQARESVPAGTPLGLLHDRLMARFPKLEPMKRSTLLAVGLDYQNRDYVLQPGDEVSLFPPVQGG